jgi:hypothetical protein
VSKGNCAPGWKRNDGETEYNCTALLDSTIAGYTAGCPFRKSYPDVLMMQSSQDRNGGNVARSLDRSMQRRIFP